MKTLRPPPADPPPHALTVRDQFALARRELTDR